MPRIKATPKTGAKKGPKAHQLAATFPSGTVLTDTWKKQWKLGNVIGQGGFGLIYRASENSSSPVGADAQYVVKIEPAANGPLFCELHFYQRAAKSDAINNWIKQKKLRYLPVPKLYGTGNYSWESNAYRFLVLPRFSTDLQKLFESCSKSFPPKAVYSIGLRMLDALEFIHESDYVHADVKAANILMGYQDGRTVSNQVYLIDFGLAFKYCVDGKHKEYKEDPRKAHDGTIEFTSRDAHNGVSPSRRGDIEILGYCLLQWLCGVLPWENNLENKDYVGDSKIKYMKDVSSLMKKCFPSGNTPDTINSFMVGVAKLKYDEKPNYGQFKQILRQGLSKIGVKDEWKLNLPTEGEGPSSPVNDKSAVLSKDKKRKSEELPNTESKRKVTSNLTPAARLVYERMNGSGNESPAGAKKVTGKAIPEKTKSSVVSVKRQKREQKTVNYNDSISSLSQEEDFIEESEESDFESKSSSSRQKKATASRLKSENSSSSPASVSKNGTKRLVRRKKTNNVDAAMQTSPALRSKR